MTDDSHNEYLELPDDPELAFAALHRRKYGELERLWETNSGGRYSERRYVDVLLAFDEVHGLGILASYRDPPSADSKFDDFFQQFRRHAEIATQKILIEAARRTKAIPQSIVVLDAAARSAIHLLINALREKLNELTLPEGKRESLFNKLNEFAAEIDRNRTRTAAFFAFVAEAARAAKAVNDEIRPLQETIDRVLDFIEKAQDWAETLPPWNERKKIEGPTMRLSGPRKGNIDDDIPF